MLASAGFDAPCLALSLVGLAARLINFFDNFYPSERFWRHESYNVKPQVDVRRRGDSSGTEAGWAGLERPGIGGKCAAEW